MDGFPHFEFLPSGSGLSSAAVIPIASDTHSRAPESSLLQGFPHFDTLQWQCPFQRSRDSYIFVDSLQSSRSSRVIVFGRISKLRDFPQVAVHPSSTAMIPTASDSLQRRQSFPCCKDFHTVSSSQFQWPRQRSRDSFSL